MSRQSQKGGDNSTNFQTEQMIVNVGIDEKRAREVFQEMNLQLKKEYTQEALSVANARVLEFENSLMPKMEKVDGALEAFADPSFQLLLVEAQKTAASTERAEDYEVLAELLIHRFKKGEDRVARAGISLAVEIVDKISNEALLGLTVMHAVNSFIPSNGDIDKGLDLLDDLFSSIITQVLPLGHDWLDHLDILRAVRLNSVGTLKKVKQYYTEVFDGYIEVGIEKTSENYSTALEILKQNNLPITILVEHSLNKDYQRLLVASRQGINDLSLLQQRVYEGRLINLPPVKLTGEQKKALNAIYDLYSKDRNLKQAHINSFMEKWNKRPSLKTLMEGWGSIPTLVTLTSVGKALAHSNAQRCNKNIPSLN